MQELLSRILEELRNTWRFRWRALLVAWLVAIGGWIFVYSLPNQYEVSARVQIDTESAIHPLLAGLAVRPNFKQKVDLLVQTVLSRPNLRDIARRTGLDIKAATSEAQESLLDRLAGAIRIRSTGGKINLFRIAFTSSNADTARSVVQQVINIMTGMAAGNGDDSAKATKFLEREVGNYKTKLEAVQRKLSAFEKDNAAMMPGRDGFVTRLQSLQADLVRLEDRKTAAGEKRADLEQQMQSAASGGSRAVPAEQSSQVRAIDNQISQARSRVQQMLTRYTPQHPDVLKAKREIERLQRERASKVSELRANPERISLANSGAYNDLKRQANDMDVEVNALQTSIKRKNQRIEELKSNAGSMTDVQSQYAELTRNYQATKEQYDNLLGRLYKARLSDDVARTGNQLKFHVIDPPELPADPSGPQRALLMTVVLIASLAAGAVFAFFMSQIRPVFINRRSLTDATGLPVLGAVSMAWSMRQNMQQRTALLLFIVGVGTLFVGYLGAMAFAPIGTRFVPVLLSNQWL